MIGTSQERHRRKRAAPHQNQKHHTRRLIYMNAKKWTAMLCAAALAVSLTACGTQATKTSDAGTTLTGRVSAVDGSEVTLLLDLRGRRSRPQRRVRPGQPDRHPAGKAGERVRHRQRPWQHQRPAPRKAGRCQHQQRRHVPGNALRRFGWPARWLRTCRRPA